MTDEPYRWLEAIGNRREYIREQLKGATPGFAVQVPEGILLLGVGIGQSKVFELFDRHGMVALGHPADIERIRQAAIDAAHMEAFTRAPEDVSLRRLVGFGLGPQLKAAFEQIFNSPFLVELLLVELHGLAGEDVLIRLRHDGTFEKVKGPVAVAVVEPELERSAATWIEAQLQSGITIKSAVETCLQTWWCLAQGKSLTDQVPDEKERRNGWRETLGDRDVEMALLSRVSNRLARYEPLTLAGVGIDPKAVA